MRKLILAILILTLFLTVCSHALSDYNFFLPSWNYYYYSFRLSGYPVYNALLDRYDFFDMDNNYRGSLCYNLLLGEYEYFGL